LEQCLGKDNSIVKFLLPKQKDAKTIIKPLMREILESCPEHLRPEYNTQDKIFNFPNGSEIHLGGSDLSAESLRGTRADLVLIDEGGFVNDLLYTIRSILSPTIRTTRGRMIIASTPSRDPQHEFIQYFMNPYKASGRLKIYDIYQNPNFTKEIIDEIIEEYPLGVEDPDFRREYLCEVFVDEETTICAEFAKYKDTIVIDDYDIPEFRDFYVGFDPGFRDLSALLFTYYDFKEACLYIMDEHIVNGSEMRTDKLANGIKEKEKMRFFDPQNNNNEEAYLRVMDINLGLQQDLQQLHGLTFLSTRKDNKDGAINEMKMWMAQGRVKIHKRCTHLIYHLEFGQWNDRRTDFKRLADTPDKTIRGGHVDTIPALYYLIRNIHTYRNPFPNNYGKEVREGTHVAGKYKNKASKSADIMRSILNLRRK
tara:strand:- start:797 stop:2068 length:1272 start_codon:yes stop_codon:yes gene_type:complete